MTKHLMLIPHLSHAQVLAEPGISEEIRNLELIIRPTHSRSITKCADQRELIFTSYATRANFIDAFGHLI